MQLHKRVGRPHQPGGVDNARTRANTTTKTARKRSIALLSPSVPPHFTSPGRPRMHAPVAVANAVRLRTAAALGFRWRDLHLDSRYPALPVNQYSPSATVRTAKSASGAGSFSR